MNILIIGANGGIGKKCVETALAKGYLVTAVVRNPAKLLLSHPGLHIVTGDIKHPEGFSHHFINKDAVISALGVSGGLLGDKPTTLYSAGAASILQEMKKTGVTRVYFISASAVEISPAIPRLVQLVAKYVLQKLLRHMYADLRLMEKLVKATTFNWTIVRPPQLTDKPATGNYRLAINHFLKNCLKIARADVAHFMINNISNEQTFRATVEIGN